MDRDGQPDLLDELPVWDGAQVGYFKIMFSTDTEGFDNSVDPGMFAYQVANILRQVNRDLEQGLDAGDLRDFVGNTVGRWERNGDASK